jgi:hypothetical protein
MTAIPLPPTERIECTLDIECYINYFLLKIKRVADRRVIGEFEMFNDSPMDRAGLQALLMVITIVTFNGRTYDVPMLSAALAGYPNAQLKYLSDAIIQRNMKPWDVEKEFNIRAPWYLDHIDLFDVMPGQHGLKMYMAKMHSETIRDLPIEPSAVIKPEDLPGMRWYCGNDLDGTIDGFIKFRKEIALRETMSKDYGIDLRSKSDAQIAEAVIKSELGFKVDYPVWAVGSSFAFDPPAFLEYQTPILQNLLALVRRSLFTLGPNKVEAPPEIESAKIKIGNSTYTIGLGGLHSCESSVYHLADADTALYDVDVASYYPRLMLNSGAYPPQIGPAFLQVFERLVDRRLAAKAAGDKATADSLKITINGTFGKTLSPYGILSAPKMGIQTTISGQLSVLMLIESLELCGIPVVSANTDGIVIKCPRALDPWRRHLVAEWEKRTGLETEENEYLALFSRDVNNYIAVKAKDRSVKLKGEYAPPIPVGGSWPNPTGEVCVDAIVAYLLDGTPLETTIRACQDVRKFVYIRNVKGGGQMVYGHEIEAATTKRGMREQLAAAGWVDVGKEIFSINDGFTRPMKDAHKLAIVNLQRAQGIRKEYLGKVVRWYYAKDSQGVITYVGSGNKVPKTDGCMPLMTLPKTLPADIDYQWYVTEAKSLLTDLGVPIV